MKNKETEISIVTLVNKPDIYQENVIESTLDIKDIIEYIVIPSPVSAAVGLNTGLEKASNDLVICCHQDVYFLNGWYNSLKRCLTLLNDKWGVCGVAGTIGDGNLVGVCSGLLMHEEDIIPIQTLDCLCIILKKSNELRFDENLKFFHMYGEDIALQANDKKMGAYVINIPLKHNSKWTSGPGFEDSYEYLKKKWKNKVHPIYTTVGTF